jgi:hypothetical protein
VKKEEFVSKNSKIKFKNKYLNRVVNNVFTAIVKNWIFQGILDLSVNEKIYKILFDVFFLVVALLMGVSGGWLILVFISVHTLNWITNDHFVDNLFHLEICKMTPEKMERSISFLRAFVGEFECIEYAGIYGRIARGEEVRSGTDIDIRFIRKRGLLNAIKACIVGHYLRCIALFRLMPIDLNIWDNVSDLNRMRKDEIPLILKGARKVRSIYPDINNSMLEKYRRYDCRRAYDFFPG